MDQFEIDENNNVVFPNDEFDFRVELDANNNLMDDRWEDERFDDRLDLPVDRQENEPDYLQTPSGDVVSVQPVESGDVIAEAGIPDGKAGVETVAVAQFASSEQEEPLTTTESEEVCDSESAGIVELASNEERIPGELKTNETVQTRGQYKPIAELVHKFQKQTPVRFRSSRMSEVPALPSRFVPQATMPRSPKFASFRLLQHRVSLGSAPKPCLSNATNTHPSANQTDRRNVAVSTKLRGTARYCPYAVPPKRVSLLAESVKNLVNQANKADNRGGHVASEKDVAEELTTIPETELPKMIDSMKVSADSNASTKPKLSVTTLRVPTLTRGVPSTSVNNNQTKSVKRVASSTSKSSSASSSAAYVFRAQEAKVLRLAPFKPAPSTQPLTVAATPKFSLPKRTEQRRRFEAISQAHRVELQRAREERDRLMREEEEEERRRLRAVATFRANPVPATSRARQSTAMKTDVPCSNDDKENELGSRL